MKTIKAWLSICTATKPYCAEMYSTRKEAEYAKGKCDMVVPCKVTYEMPKKGLPK